MKASMRRPIVLVPACVNQIGAHPYHTAQLKYVAAVAEGASCAPLIVPALGAATDIEALLAVADGVMLTGSPSNVHAGLYGEAWQSARIFTYTDMDEWLNAKRVTEIECLVPDLTGVARGKILPRGPNSPRSAACACRKRAGHDRDRQLPVR
jgi:hypothetical protein